MPKEMEIPSHVRTWEKTNPIAFELYKEAFNENPKDHMPETQEIVEPLAQKAVDNISSHPENLWKIFKQAAHELNDPTDTNQVMALYDAVYGKLDLMQKKKLAYHMAY